MSGCYDDQVQTLALFGLIFACVVFVGAIAFVGSHAVRRREQARYALWSEWAHARGGVFTPQQGGWWRPHPASMTVPHRHATVFVDTYVVSTGKSSTTYTRARARFPLGFGPCFRVTPEGLLQSLGKALGVRDIELDDVAFDPRFVVKGETPAAIRVAWTPAARASALVLSRPNVTSDGAEVTVSVRGVLVALDELDALVSVAGELASYRVGELAELARATDATLVSPPGSWERPIAPVLRWSSSRGDVEASFSREGLAMRIADTRGLPESRVVLGEGGELEEIPAVFLSDGSRALLPQVGSCELVAERGALWILWSGLPDAMNLRAGSRLLGELAGGNVSRGAFR